MNDELQKSYDEIKKENQELLELQNSKQMLIDMVVHDLKNSLNGVQGNIDLLLSLEKLDEKSKNILLRARRGCNSLLTIIMNLLDISKTESGELTLNYEEFDLKELVEQNVTDFEPLTMRSNQKVSVKIYEDSTKTKADKELINRVIVNLIHNAIKFTPVNGSITIEINMEPESKKLVFSIMDSGKGIPKEYHSKIFDKLGQVELKASGQRTASGLGLVFCKMVIELHGEKIWLESEGEREARFLFTLPLVT